MQTFGAILQATLLSVYRSSFLIHFDVVRIAYQLKVKSTDT